MKDNYFWWLHWLKITLIQIGYSPDIILGGTTWRSLYNDGYNIYEAIKISEYEE